MKYEKVLKELFFLWQESLEYEKDVTYENIMQYLSVNLSDKQISELEELLSLDTFDKQLQAFEGGFQMGKELLFAPKEDLKLYPTPYSKIKNGVANTNIAIRYGI